MTPLVDVVMVILIFLMLTGSFGAGAFFLPSNAPIRSGGKGQYQGEVPKIPDPQLDIYLATLDDTTFKARVGSGEEFFNGVSRSGKKLVDHLKELKAKQESPDKLQVVLAPRLSTRYKHIIELYQICMAAELPKIGFQTARD
jgi:biopolymer transport protein ExbD